MKAVSGAAMLSTILAAASATDANTNPVAKVLDMISGLQSKVIGEGEAAQKVYDEFAEWCEENSKTLQFEIKTAKTQIEDLKATISSETSTIASLTAKVEELSSTIATADADLKAATDIRNKEASDFAAEEKELMEILDTLGRAIGILEQEMKKSGGAALLQSSAGNMVQALSAMVQAAGFSSADASRLTALVQNSADSEDSESDVGAPAGAVYEGHSGGILETLGGLHDKATEQLDAARAKETAALHAFQMLKQSLEDQLKFANADMAAANKNIAASEESKATAEGDLDLTSKSLASDTKGLADLHHNCMTKATDYEAETKSRGEELTALATAKKIIVESTSGATSQSYSFLQTATRSKLSSTVDLANFEAMRIIRDLARKENSHALAQLASRMASVSRMGTSDPFTKIKGLISDMIDKLEAEAEADATKEAWCDKEMAESKAKEEEMNNDISKLSTKIDQMSSRSAQLKEEVAAAQKSLQKIAKSQAEMNKLRAEENSAYKTNRAEMEQGVEGIKAALKVLRDYYAKDDHAHQEAEGSSTGIIGLLEVCESDFTKNLAEIIATEESAQAAYDQETKDNEIETANLDKDVEYKTKEYTGLDKAVTEASSDRAGVQSELDAVVAYMKKLDEQCIVQPDTYAERKRRREEELAGLKEALNVLENEAASLVQKGARHSLRGVRRHN